MLKIYEGACPTLMLQTSYSASLFSYVYSSQVKFVYWNVGCDNNMINFANVDSGLPDRLDGNVLIGTLVH